MRDKNVEQRVVYIAGHLAGVAANIDSSTIFYPAIKFSAGFANPVLYVNLVPLIPRECDIKSRQAALLEVR